MSSLGDRLLAGGNAAHIHAVHAETVTVLSGESAGASYLAVVENEGDHLLGTALGEDPRARRLVRFQPESVPTLASQNVLRTADGTLWFVVKQRFDSYLTVDFELVEKAAAIDT